MEVIGGEGFSKSKVTFPSWGRADYLKLFTEAGISTIGLCRPCVSRPPKLRSSASVLTPRDLILKVTFLPEGCRLFLSVPTAHQNRVSAIIFSLATEWMVSTGHDKCVSWMCTRNGDLLGRHFFTSWASCLQYPSKGWPFACPGPPCPYS